MHQHHSLTIDDDKWWRHQLGHMTSVYFAHNKLIFGDISENEYDVMNLYINFQLSITSTTIETERWSVLPIIYWLSAWIVYTCLVRHWVSFWYWKDVWCTIAKFHQNPTKHHIVVKETLQKRAISCLKNVPIRSFSGPYFPAFGLNTERYGVRENTD